MQLKLGARVLETLKPQARPYDVRDADLCGLLIRVNPSGLATYYADYRNSQGTRKRLRLGRVGVLSLAQARDQARVALGEVAQGIDPAVQRKRARLHSLEKFLEVAYAPWAKASLKQSDQAVARIKACFPTLLGTRLDEITAWKIERWISDRRKDGIAGATINRDLAVLRSCLARAVEWDFLPKHPLASVKPQRVDQTGKVRFLSGDEENRLMDALRARESTRRAARESANVWRIERDVTPMPNFEGRTFTDHLFPMVLVSLNTGLRQGELFSLRWSDVDLNAKRLTVRGARAKSGQTRHIPLNKVALESLSTLAGHGTEPDGLVFIGRSGETFNNVKRSWAKVLTKAGITEFRWHDMRHHFASRLVQRGTDLNTVRALLGHKDLKMTLRYAHLSPEVMAEAVRRLESRPRNVVSATLHAKG